jgi:hypothetical protein
VGLVSSVQLQLFCYLAVEWSICDQAAPKFLEANDLLQKFLDLLPKMGTDHCKVMLLLVAS